MAAEDMGLVQAQQRLDNGLNHPQLVFHDTYNCGPPPTQRRATAATSVGDPKTTTRELTGGFIDHHHYFNQPLPTDFRRGMFSAAVTGDRPHQDNSHNWNLSSRASATPSGDGSEDDDDEVEDDDEDDDNDDENEVEGLVRIDNNNSSNDKTNNRNKMGNQKSKQLSSFGLKEGNVVGRSGNTNEDNNCDMRNAVTIANADGELYYSQYMQGSAEVGPNAGQKDAMGVENGCGFSGRKEGLYLSESGESLRAILSDPFTGALMDDAIILPCGHSFGSGGMQHLLRMKSCYTCSQTVSEDSISPNLCNLGLPIVDCAPREEERLHRNSLRAAVQAFRREEEMQVHRTSKRRRERYEQDKGTYGESVQTDHPRGRGVQFPFTVTDRVVIKGNKRTPPRFVGREAIVTTQCLNGWYVVKTLDNAESVKLQYRSLSKVPENASPKPISSKMTPNWL